MTTDLTEDRRRAQALAQEAAELSARIERRERECPHNRSEQYWSTAQEKRQDGVRSEPDPSRPIFAGVDIMRYETREVFYQTRYWERHCQLCGKVEKTTKTRDVVTKVPDFR